jgi:hypothetical protein
MSVKETTLQDLADKLLNKYSSGTHYEIVKAEKIPLGFKLEVRQIFEEEPVEEKNEGADNDNN